MEISIKFELLNGFCEIIYQYDSYKDVGKKLYYKFFLEVKSNNLTQQLAMLILNVISCKYSANHRAPLFFIDKN